MIFAMPPTGCLEDNTTFVVAEISDCGKEGVKPPFLLWDPSITLPHIAAKELRQLHIEISPRHLHL